MVGVGQNCKVFNSVVMGVSVHMVHMLPGLKFAAKMLFHNVPMNANLFSVYHHGFIRTFWPTYWLKTQMRELLQMHLSQTRSGTISGCFSPVGGHSERLPALLAHQNGASSISLFHTRYLRTLLSHKTAAGSR
jgi:hypothetical protein